MKNNNNIINKFAQFGFVKAEAPRGHVAFESNDTRFVYKSWAEAEEAVNLMAEAKPEVKEVKNVELSKEEAELDNIERTPHTCDGKYVVKVLSAVAQKEEIVTYEERFTHIQKTFRRSPFIEVTYKVAGERQTIVDKIYTEPYGKQRKSQLDWFIDAVVIQYDDDTFYKMPLSQIFTFLKTHELNIWAVNDRQKGKTYIRYFEPREQQTK